MKLLILLFVCMGSIAFAANSGGGGFASLYRGKLLDSYIADPDTLPGFESLAPQLAILNGSYDTKNVLAAVLHKNWYLLPGPLSALPTEAIGAAVPTDQGALQDFASVWIDQDILYALPEEQQKWEILHEIFMGFRLFKYESLYDQCRVLYSEGHCQDMDHTSKKPSDLTKQDYEAIRRVVRKFLDHPPKDKSELYHLLRDEGFAFPHVQFKTYEDDPISNPEDLFHAFATANLVGQWPQFGYEQEGAVEPKGSYGYTPSAKFSPTNHCKISFKRNEKGTGFHLEVHARNRKPYVFNVDEIRDAFAERGEFFFYVTEDGRVFGRGEGDNQGRVAVGTKVTWLSIEINGYGGNGHDGKYYTTAALGDISIKKGVRIDSLGNDAIDVEQSILCSNNSPYDPSKAWPLGEPWPRD